MSYYSGIKQALEQGKADKDYTANTFECRKGDFGRLVCHYNQGRLTNLWHVESDRIWTVPVVFEQLAGDQIRAEHLFRGAVEKIKKEGFL